MRRNFHLALLVMSGLARAASAQSTANTAVAAKAFVLGMAPLSVGTQAHLLFGPVTAGFSASPTNVASNTGRFLITGQPSTPVVLAFILPTVLTSSLSATVPITFNATDGFVWTAFPLTRTTFDPNASYLTALGVTGNLLIGISGTVSPPLGTPTGLYSGTITMTVSY